MAATIRRSSQNSNVYGAYGIVSSDRLDCRGENTDCPSSFNWRDAMFRNVGSRFKITEPRLLNGAQTVTTFSRFSPHKANEGNSA